MCSRSGRSSRRICPACEPLLRRAGAGELGLDLLVADEPAVLGVDEEHPARLQAALAHDLGRVEVEHPGLGGEHDQAVVGDRVPARAQAVAVQDRADEGAVGEGHAGRAIPGLHEVGVVGVERPPGRVHRRVVLPRLGDHHQHGVRQRAPAEVEQLEHLVEGRRVRRPRRADREEPGEVAGDEVGGEHRLAGAHPVAVALDGVDLAVVGEQPVGVGERPGRERVGREPGVHQGQLGLEARVGQVGEEGL